MDGLDWDDWEQWKQSITSKMEEQTQTISIQPHQFTIDSPIEDNEKPQSPIYTSIKFHKMEHQSNGSTAPPHKMGHRHLKIKSPTLLNKTHKSHQHLKIKSPTSLKPRKPETFLGKILILGALRYWETEDIEDKSLFLSHNPTED